MTCDHAAQGWARPTSAIRKGNTGALSLFIICPYGLSDFEPAMAAWMAFTVASTRNSVSLWPTSNMVPLLAQKTNETKQHAKLLLRPRYADEAVE